MSRVAALEAKFASGTAATTVNMIVGGTVSLVVTLNKTMPSNGYVCFASITSSSGLFGSVIVSQVQATSTTSVTVVLQATALITGQTVTVNVIAIAI